MQSGNRVFTPAEWEVFIFGLGLVRDSIEEDIRDGVDYAVTGVAIFDRCSPEQKLALLADVSIALQDPKIPCPKHTAVNEGTVAAVLRRFWSYLAMEVEVDGKDYVTAEFRYNARRVLLAVFVDESEIELPDISETDVFEWSRLYEEFEDRIFWDEDFAMTDDLIDLAPEQMETSLQFLQIDRDYFVSVPREPNKAELISARQILARMLGHPATDDSGFYSFLEDNYNDLLVGPCSAEEITAWEAHPWVQSVGCAELSCDCSYEKWQTLFTAGLPAIPYVLNLEPVSDDMQLPKGITIEQFGSHWVVREENIGLWCGLMNNCWTDGPDDDEPLLTFATEQLARSAYLHAYQMYTERAVRRKVAFKKLRIPDLD